MFRSSLQRGVQRLVQNAQARRAASSKAVSTPTGSTNFIPNTLLQNWYKTFGQSSIMYGTWLISLIIVGEFVTGKLSDALWTANNYGKTFETVDWSKFDQFEDDEDEDDDEEDDDDE